MSPHDKRVLEQVLRMLLGSGDISPIGAREIARIFNLEEGTG